MAVSPKSKMPARRPVKKSAIAPPPVGPLGGMSTSDPVCGHSACGAAWNVRYVGPTSHIRDHHILHAAYGASHVWAAAVIAGLAIVITMTVAFSSQAATSTPSISAVMAAVQNLNRRMDKVDAALVKIGAQCAPAPAKNAADSKPTPTDVPTNPCMVACSQTTLSCLKDAGDNTDAKAKCLDADKSCRASCQQPTSTTSSDVTGQ